MKHQYKPRNNMFSESLHVLITLSFNSDIYDQLNEKVLIIKNRVGRILYAADYKRVKSLK